MFLEMVLKTIPRSLRAGVTLVIMIVLLVSGFRALQQIVLPGEDSTWTIIRCVGGLVLGFVATGFFFYYQHADGTPKKYSDLETLSKYHETERLKKIKITPAYDEKMFETDHKPPKTP